MPGSTVKELKAQAKSKGIKGYSTMKKAQLEKVIAISPKKKTEKQKLKSKSRQTKMIRWMVLENVPGVGPQIISSFKDQNEAILFVLKNYLGPRKFGKLSDRELNLIQRLIEGDSVGNTQLRVEQWKDVDKKVYALDGIRRMVSLMIDEQKEFITQQTRV